MCRRIHLRCQYAARRPRIAGARANSISVGARSPRMLFSRNALALHLCARRTSTSHFPSYFEYFNFVPHLDPPCPQVLAYLLRLRWVYRLCPRKFLQVRLSLRVLRFGLYSALFLLILCSLLYPVFLSGADAVSRLRKETNRIGVSWHRHLWLLSAFRAPNQGRSGKGVM